MEITFADGRRFELPLRVPARLLARRPRCAATGPGRRCCRVGKREVDIVGVEPVGSYAIQPQFSDGHDTGIYSWDYLYELGVNRDGCGGVPAAPRRAGASREVDATAVHARGGRGCATH